MRGDLLRRWGLLAHACLASSCGFTGPALTVTDDAGVDAPLPPAVVNFAADMSTEDEMSGAIQVEVTLDRPATSTITVPYRIVDNSGAEWATPGADFDGADGTITFNPGESLKGIDLVIIGDAMDEGNEKIQLELQAPTGDAMLGSTTSHTVTINAFFLPRVRFSTATGGGNEDVGTVNLVLMLNPAPTTAVTVGYTVTGDAEIAGTYPDHNLLATGTVSIAAGATMANLPVTITADTTDEDLEHVVVTLTSSTNAVIDQDNDTTDYEITDDDAAPSVTFQTASVTVSQDEAEADVTLIAELSARSEKAITVGFAQNTTGVTFPASLGTDFSYTTTGLLSWGAGTTTLTKSIVVHVTDDALDEENEVVETIFNTPTNVSIPTNTKSTLTITNTDTPPAASWQTADLGDVNETDTDADRTLVVQLSAASGKTVTVGITATGAAIYDDPTVGGQPNGWDYTTGAGQIPVSFSPGVTTRNITLTIRGDNTDEPGNPARDDAKLTLSNPVNCTINTNADELDFVIVDDD